MTNPHENAGEEDEEGGGSGEVWDQIRCISAEDGEEDGSDSAREVHMHVLWEGFYEENCRRDLEVWCM